MTLSQRIYRYHPPFDSGLLRETATRRVAALDLPARAQLRLLVDRDSSKAGRGKVDVERKGRANPSLSHEHERRAVHQGEFLIVKAAKQLIGGAFRRSIHVDDEDSRARMDAIDEPERGGVIVGAAEERVRFTHDQVARDEREPARK